MPGAVEVRRYLESLDTHPNMPIVWTMRRYVSLGMLAWRRLVGVGTTFAARAARRPHHSYRGDLRHEP